MFRFQSSRSHQSVPLSLWSIFRSAFRLLPVDGSEKLSGESRFFEGRQPFGEGSSRAPGPFLLAMFAVVPCPRLPFFDRQQTQPRTR